MPEVSLPPLYRQVGWYWHAESGLEGVSLTPISPAAIFAAGVTVQRAYVIDDQDDPVAPAMQALREYDELMAEMKHNIAVARKEQRR